jgi:septal ring-binding cell division protein DamX
MGFMKKLVFLGLLGLVGWGMYHAGQNNLFSFLEGEAGEPIQMVKKDRAVKSRSFARQVKDVVPAPVKQYDYTFFETLDDVDLERYVDLDGKVKVMKRTVHSWVEEVEKVIDEPRILLASYKDPDDGSSQLGGAYDDIIRKLDDLMKEKPKKKVTPPAASTGPARRSVTPVIPSSSVKRAVPSAQSRKPYRVQVSSFRKLTQARALESTLKQKGYSAFVMSVEVSKTKGHWYRVFLGDYQTAENARAAARKAQRLHHLKTLVLKASR